MPPAIGLSLQELTARYVYQVQEGCSDPHCSQPFCRKNIKKHFLGRGIRLSAAPALACHLAASKGETGLCTQLRSRVLPKNISLYIDPYDPLRLSRDAPNTPSSDKPLDLILDPGRSSSGTGTQTASDNPSSSPPSNSYSLQASLLSTVTFRNYWPILSTAKLVALAKGTIRDPGNTLSPKPPPWLPALQSVCNFVNFRRVLCSPESPFIAFKEALTSIRTSASGKRHQPVIRMLILIISHHRQRFLREEPTVVRRIDELLGLLLITLNDPYGLSYCPPIFHDAGNFITPEDTNAKLLYSHSFDVYMRYWPSSIAFSGALTGLHQAKSYFDQIILPDTYLPISPLAFFRRYSSYSRASTVYLSQTPWILDRPKRHELFRYGCLKQMAAATERLSKINQVMTKTEFFPATLEDPMRKYTASLMDVSYFIMDIDRNDFLNSAVQCLGKALQIENMIRRPLKVRFGVGEVAVDHGGVQVEFFQLLGHQLLNSGHGLFIEDPNSRKMWFNPAYSGPAMIYQYIGMLFGLALYNGCIVDVQFPSFFYHLLLNDVDSYVNKLSVSDMEELMPDVASSLRQLLRYPAQDFERDFYLSFESGIQYDDGSTYSIHLPSFDDYPEGAVTAENRARYVSEYVRFRLYDSVRELIQNFSRGLKFVISSQLLQLLTVEDLQMLLEGTAPEIDINTLEKVVDYSDGYDRSSITVSHFWSVVREFDEAQKRQLLEFITGSKRVPIGGLSRLPFTIQRNGTDCTRIPSASVCFSRLLLPDYKSRAQLKRMLLLALDNAQGFGLV